MKVNSFEIGNDFVIRCMFATAGIGTRLDFDLLRRQSNVEKIQNIYADCFNAIRKSVDFAKSDCGIDSAKLLGGINTLVPLVYFLYKTSNRTFSVMSRANARKSLLLFAFSRVLSQHVDSRAGGFIRNYLQQAEELTDFPLSSAIRYVNSHTGIETADSYFFGLNIDLALAIVQSKAGGKVKHFSNRLEIDHIFPKAKLYEKNYDPADVNRIGNYWMLPLGINRNKSAQHPSKFFADVEQSVLDAALIDKSKLDYRSFLVFTRERENSMASKLVEATGLNQKLFDSALADD